MGLVVVVVVGNKWSAPCCEPLGLSDEVGKFLKKENSVACGRNFDLTLARGTSPRWRSRGRTACLPLDNPPSLPNRNKKLTNQEADFDPARAFSSSGRVAELLKSPSLARESMSMGIPKGSYEILPFCRRRAGSPAQAKSYQKITRSLPAETLI